MSEGSVELNIDQLGIHLTGWKAALAFVGLILLFVFLPGVAVGVLIAN